MVYLNEQKVSQLKSLAKNLKLTGYSRLAGVGQAVNLLAVSHRVDNGGPISGFGIAESASHCLPDLLRRNIRVHPVVIPAFLKLLTQFIPAYLPDMAFLSLVQNTSPQSTFANSDRIFSRYWPNTAQ